MFVRLRYVLLLFLGGAVGVILRIEHPDPNSRLSFIAVGQGDCAVFQSAGATVLIDAAPKAETFDAGERIAVPELYRLGVEKIDLLLLSHPDSDHVGGMPAIARRFKIGKVCIPVSFRKSAEMLSWLQASGISAGDVLWLGREAVARVGKFEVRMDCPKLGADGADNEGSMFVRIVGEGCSAVFSGDAGISTEESMIAAGADWRSQILKAGHHGSKGSMGWRWIRAVGPSYVVFSAGRNNVYGHPSNLAILRAKNAGIPYYRTDQSGTITFDLTPKGFQPELR